jgi:hypothetical protein
VDSTLCLIVPALIQLSSEAEATRQSEVTQLRLAGACIGIRPLCIWVNPRVPSTSRWGAPRFPSEASGYLPHSGQFLQFRDAVHNDVYSAVSRCHPGPRPHAVATQHTSLRRQGTPAPRMCLSVSLILCDCDSRTRSRVRHSFRVTRPSTLK